MTVADAAEMLGVSQDAIRQRIRRGTIAHEKDESGRVYVYVDPTHTDHDSVRNAGDDGVHDALIEELRKQNEFLRAELERKDAILLTMARRIPELEPASSPEPPESPVSPSEAYGGGKDHPDQERPSWWRRIFG
jgi:excisionase family DNA binding protein